MPKRRDPSYAGQCVTLFHAARSNCSARVRLLLAEKSLSWESRLLSLQKKENRTPEYFAVNPKGLVPSLIHDGWVVTESNDILYYLEETFPEPGFLPGDATKRAVLDAWMDRSAALHLPGVKTFNYSKNYSRPISGGAAKTSPQDMAHYRALQTDPDLIRFHETAGGDGFSLEERSQAEAMLSDALGAMDAILADQPWLTGSVYSLVDICWVTTIPTLARAGLDLGPFAHVRAWHRRIAERPAYSAAVTEWETMPG